MTNPNKKPQALYLHVPFCRSICYYCDFVHRPYQQEAADRWLDALEYEISKKKINPDLRTVYIGGGTPTSLNEEQLARMLSLLDPCTEKAEEYTCEINPETLTAAKAELLALHGVNRASIGFQTGSDRLLKMMGRHHTAEDVKTAMELLKEAGIGNISLDLMYSLPGQTMADLKEAAEYAVSLEPKHLSLYSLTIEENTVFAKKGYRPLDEDTEADMYEYICSTLPEKGFRQYEISNFARPGYESKHNLVYWHYEDFYGLSAGASGKENHCRYDNVRSLPAYLKDPLQKEIISLGREDEMFETVMMGLRLKEGMSLSSFEERFSVSFEEAFGEKAEKLLIEGKLEIAGNQIKCADAYYHLLNSVLEELL